MPIQVLLPAHNESGNIRAIHDEICKALDGFSGSITVKDPCGELKKAAGYLAKAKPFGDSAEIVPTAQRLVAMIETMRAGARAAGFRRC